MSSDQSLWYRLGYALERARTAPTKVERKLASLDARRPRRHATDEPSAPGIGAADDLLVSGAVVLLTRVLEAWRPRRSAGVVGLLRAAASGAGAALLVELVRPLLSGERRLAPLGEDTPDRLLAGAAQGLVYGGVVEPRLPGPALLKGALYGSVEHAVHPMGGLYRVLGPHAPRVPGMGALLDDLDPRDRAYLEHVTFGIVLSLLYGVGSRPRSSGIAVEDDE